MLTEFEVSSAFFGGILRCASERPLLRTAVSWPCSEASLYGALLAKQKGLAEPVLFGPRQHLLEIARAIDVDLVGIDVIDVSCEEQAAAEAVRMCKTGDAESLMKGSLHTSTFMHAILDPDSGLARDRRVSHVFVIDSQYFGRPVLVTDAAINIRPTVDQKAEIIQNAVDVAKMLGISLPGVAVLSAIEVIDTAIQSSVDAAVLSKMAERGQIRGCRVEGPLAFDTAVSAASAKTKRLASPLAGAADILMAPDIESGNILAKALGSSSGTYLAGIAVGADVPIVLNSRADSAQTRVLSCAVAAILRACRRCDA